MKDLLYSEDNDFYIDGLKISGVSSIRGSYSIPNEENNFLGYTGPIGLAQNAPGKASFSVSRAMITSDEPITSLIADTGFNGGVVYNGKELGFNSGYLSSYSISFNVGSVPKTSISVEVFGDMGPGISPSSSSPKQSSSLVPSSSGISVDCDGRSTNRVSNFSYGIEIERMPMYKIGSIFPSEIMTILPIKNNFSIRLEVDDYETKNVYDYIKTGIHNKNFDIKVRDFCDQSKYTLYKISGAHLVSEGFSADNDNNTTVDLTYVSYINGSPGIEYS